MKRHPLSWLLVILLGGLNPVALHAAEDAVQVIFANGQLTVIDAQGVQRLVRQGQFVRAGERIITPPGITAQFRLPDGTLLGARPGTDLKLESLVDSLGKNILVLREGNVRVINLASPSGSNPKPVDVVGPASTMQLRSGDGETALSRTGIAGNYSRLQTGSATLRTTSGEVALEPMKLEAVRSGGADAPKVVAAQGTAVSESASSAGASLVLQGTDRVPAAVPAGTESSRLEGAAVTATAPALRTLTAPALEPVKTAVQPTAVLVSPAPGPMSPTVTSTTSATGILSPARTLSTSITTTTISPTLK